MMGLDYIRLGKIVGKPRNGYRLPPHDLALRTLINRGALVAAGLASITARLTETPVEELYIGVVVLGFLIWGWLFFLAWWAFDCPRAGRWALIVACLAIAAITLRAVIGQPWSMWLIASYLWVYLLTVIVLCFRQLASLRPGS